MLRPPAEESYRTGLQALAVGRRREAMARFEAAIELERRLGSPVPQARYLSYYGLCLAIVNGKVSEALRFCREAVDRESYNPDLRCNLGRVLMRAGRRREAYQTFAAGLGLQTDHRGLRLALRTMGVRRRPVLPFLARSHPLNVLLGRLRQAA